MEKFTEEDLTKLWQPTDAVGKFDGGQVTIVGGSSLFHGAPILALRTASRLASMVYFATPEADRAVVERIKSLLGSFIWVPQDELDDYVEKSDAILIGPGMMRKYEKKDGSVCEDEGEKTLNLSLDLFGKFGSKKWVVDGGSLQMVKVADLPKGAVITPNRKEYRILFGEDLPERVEEKIEKVMAKAKEFGLIIVAKDVVSVVTDGERAILVEGGNAGLIKGGTGDVMAGLTVGLLAKNEPLLAAAAAQYLTKKAAEKLGNKFGLMYNADDLAEEVCRK